ncbi:MAG: nuclear transport factor 2 family protein [Xanthomonadales bacterium]|nr:nuclear transport factor 2 family protein [Xanthomonadales bacterium]
MIKAPLAVLASLLFLPTLTLATEAPPSAATVTTATPVHVAVDQQALLASANPKLAANKQLVYDFWRVVFEGCHLDQADKYLSKGYIQHNPTVPTGRAGFVTFLSQYCQPKPIASTIQAKLISIVAERDMVVLSFANQHADPKHPGKTYTSTWFDMFRIADGKIAEHWDPQLKQ